MNSRNQRHRRILAVYLMGAEPFLFCLWLISFLTFKEWRELLLGALAGGVLLFAANFAFYKTHRSNSRDRKFLYLLSAHSILFLTICGVVFFRVAFGIPGHVIGPIGGFIALCVFSLIAAVAGTAAKWLVWVLGTIWVGRENRKFEPAV